MFDYVLFIILTLLFSYILKRIYLFFQKAYVKDKFYKMRKEILFQQSGEKQDL